MKCSECNGRGHFLMAMSTPTCDVCAGTGLRADRNLSIDVTIERTERQPMWTTVRRDVRYATLEQANEYVERQGLLDTLEAHAALYANHDGLLRWCVRPGAPESCGTPAQYRGHMSALDTKALRDLAARCAP